MNQDGMNIQQFEITETKTLRSNNSVQRVSDAIDKK